MNFARHIDSQTPAIVDIVFQRAGVRRECWCIGWMGVRSTQLAVWTVLMVSIPEGGGSGAGGGGGGGGVGGNAGV